MDKQYGFHMEADGTCNWVVVEADGSKRPATEQERAEADAEFDAGWEEMQRKTVATWDRAVHDPEARPTPTTKYLEFVRWKKGLAPDHAPSIGELLILAAENVRETYGTGEQPAAVDQRTADSKTDNGKKSSAAVPENNDVAKLARDIKRRLPQGDTKIQIARDFADGDEKQAKSLLRQLRRFPSLLE